MADNTSHDLDQQLPAEDAATAVEAEGSPDAPADAVASEEPTLEVVDGDARPVQFGPLPEASTPPASARPLDLLLDVKLQLTVELGRKELTVKDALALGPGSVVELDRVAGEPVDLFVNGKLIARGEVVVIDENFGIRVTEVVSAAERLSRVA